MTPGAPTAGIGSSPLATLALLAAAALLAFAATRVGSAMGRAPGRWRRPLGILMGGMLGVAASMPVAAVLNPLVGLERGTFHNLAIMAICLGFIGFCTGSLGGLIYAGMIPSPPPRNEEESSRGTDFHRMLEERTEPPTD